jgi:hypothetical protein
MSSIIRRLQTAGVGAVEAAESDSINKTVGEEGGGSKSPLIDTRSAKTSEH